MSQPEKPNESFADTRNWDFKARSQVIDIFVEDLNKTSATDFFNRTNGLGSPEYYAEKRMKQQQEEKENALKTRRVTRGRSQISQKVEVKKAPAPKKVIDEQEKQKQTEALKRRFSSLNIPSQKPAAVTKPASVTAPKQAAVTVAKPSPVRVLRSNSGVAAKPISVVNAPKPLPVRVTRSNSGVSKPLPVVNVPKPAVEKPTSAVTESKPTSDSIAPKLPSENAPTRRRFSFMMPTQSSMRRSVNFKK